MLSLILPVIVLIALYFIYSQLSSLNCFAEEVVSILQNNITDVKNNSEKISNEISQVYKEQNEQSIFNPEYLLNKLMTPNNSKSDDLEEIDDLKNKIQENSDKVLNDLYNENEHESTSSNDENDSDEDIIDCDKIDSSIKNIDLEQDNNQNFNQTQSITIQQLIQEVQDDDNTTMQIEEINNDEDEEEEEVEEEEEEEEEEEQEQEQEEEVEEQEEEEQEEEEEEEQEEQEEEEEQEVQEEKIIEEEKKIEFPTNDNTEEHVRENLDLIKQINVEEAKPKRRYNRKKKV